VLVFGGDGMVRARRTRAQAMPEGGTITIETATDDLAAGRLVKPFDLSFSVKYAFYLVCPVVLRQNPNVQAFCLWLHDEARKTEAVLGKSDRTLPVRAD